MADTRILLQSSGPRAGLTFSTGERYDLPIAERLAKNPFMMAPMAGVTDAAYRLMARAGGAGLCYTEMVSVAGIHYNSDKTFELADPDAAEGELAVQIFGSKPEQFAEAATRISERLGNKLALIDINMACPVPKVVKKGEGSALLDEPELAARIVKETLAHTNAEVTCKIRVGRRPDALVGPEFARRMADAGAAAIAVHGRTAKQMYAGSSQDELVAQVAQATDVPVIASGDIFDPQRAVHAVQNLGCAGAFVARGSYGNPWIFGDALDLLSQPLATEKNVLQHGATEKYVAQHGFSQKLAALDLHIHLLEATGAHMARARSLCGWYLRGMPDATTWRARAMSLSTADQFSELLAELKASLLGAESMADYQALTHDLPLDGAVQVPEGLA